jgi:hypothetical protein
LKIIEEAGPRLARTDIPVKDAPIKCVLDSFHLKVV